MRTLVTGGAGFIGSAVCRHLIHDTDHEVVNLDKLAALYPEGGTVSVDDLIAKGAVRDNELVKVLGTGELTVALDVKVDAWSKSAKEKIEKAGGSVSER